MCGARPKSDIHGEPFCAVESTLVDYKPGFPGCNAVIRLERD